MEFILQQVLEQIARIDTGVQICTSRILALESRVESMEHLLNQQSMLHGTLGSIMEELKKQER